MRTKTTLTIERADKDWWRITSPDLPGLLVADKTLGGALAETYPCIEALWNCMVEAASKGEQTTAGAEQMASYEPLFQVRN